MIVKVANMNSYDISITDEVTGEVTQGTETEVIFKITNDAGFIETFRAKTTNDTDVVKSAWDNLDQTKLNAFLNRVEEEPGNVIGSIFDPKTGKVVKHKR